MINFKSQYISPSTILKRTSDGSYQDVRASFVKIDVANNNDIEALRKVSEKWEGKKNFSKDIFMYASTGSMFPGYDQDDCYYALTEQCENFKNLDSDKVLGLTMTNCSDPQQEEICFLQTMPDTVFECSERLYKNVGKSIIENMQKLYPLKDLVLIAVKNSVNFYKKLGFEFIKNSKTRMILHHK